MSGARKTNQMRICLANLSHKFVLFPFAYISCSANRKSSFDDDDQTRGWDCLDGSFGAPTRRLGGILVGWTQFSHNICIICEINTT